MSEIDRTKVQELALELSLKLYEFRNVAEINASVAERTISRSARDEWLKASKMFSELLEIARLNIHPDDRDRTGAMSDEVQTGCRHNHTVNDGGRTYCVGCGAHVMPPYGQVGEYFGPAKTFIGDGVYAEWDGYQVWLSTVREDGTEHRIALDRETFTALLGFAKGKL